MADNETRIRITAVDDATATLNQIQGAAGQLAGSFTRLQGAFAALAAIGPIAGLAASISSAVKAAAGMEELSQKTGIATDKLSALDYAMRREGVSTEAFAKGIKELSKNMVEAGDASSKMGKLFGELGVNSRGDTREALLKIADTFAALPDGATKAALAVQLFGKAGMDLIPALNNGAAGIEKIEEQARRLGITLTQETGKAAKEFADNMFAVQESGKALGVTLANLTIPSLVRISQAMREAAEDGGFLKAVFVGLGGAAAEAFGLADSEAQKQKKRIKDLEAEIIRAQQVIAEGGKDLGGGIVDRSRVNEAIERVRVLRAELHSLQTLADAQAGKFGDAVSRRQAQGQDLGAGKRLEGRFSGRRVGEKDSAALKAFGEDLDKVLAKVLAASQGIEVDFPKSVAALNVAVTTGQIGLDAYGKALEDLFKRQPFVKQALEQQVAAARVKNAEVEKEIELEQRLQEEQNRSIRSVREYAEQLEFETTLVGLSNAEREKAIALRRLEAAGIDTTTESVQALVNRIRDQVQAQEDIRKQVSVWDELSDRGSRFFYDLATSGRDAFKTLKASLKSFAAEMIALFAKRWILQLGASMTGSTALSALAGETGSGSLAGSLLSSAGSLIGGSGFLAGAAQSGLSAILGGGTGGAVAASEILAMAGPYAAAIAAAYVLYETFKDKGENWKGRIGFGDAASAYSVDGVFGRQGFQYLAGNDAVNRQIQSFFASTLGIDNQLARGLTPAQIEAIKAGLLRYNTSGTRADGQPAEFAFGKGDDTATAQLTLEFLKQKYSVVFDEIDTEFAAFIRGYTGKAEDLLKAIGDFAGVLGQLDSLGIKGFDLKALKAFQKEGEEIGTTFARVAQQWSQYQDLFLSDAEKLALAQNQLTKAFADIGVEMPKTNEEFKKLVAGLDLSTDAGRTLFAQLMQLAPAFAGVTNAAAALLSQFKEIAGNRTPALRKVFLEQDLEATVNEFMQRNPWTRGMDWRAVAQQINLLPTFAGGAADFAGYSPQDQALILKILGLSDDLEGLGDAATSAGDALRGMQTNAAAAAASWLDIKMGLWRFLRDLYTTPEFSPLDPGQRLDTLKGRFTEAIAQANSGNIGAGQSLSGLIEQILRAGREVFGSGPGYVDLFNWVTGMAGDFVQPGGGAELQRLAYEESRRQTTQLVEIRQLLIAIRDMGPAHAEAVAAATLESGATVSQAIANAPAALERR